MEIAVVAYTSLCTVTRKVGGAVVEPGWTFDGAVDSCWCRRGRSGGGVSFASAISKGEVSKKEVRILNIDGGAAATPIDTSNGENERRQSRYGMIGDPHRLYRKDLFTQCLAFTSLPFVEEVRRYLALATPKEQNNAGCRRRKIVDEKRKVTISNWRFLVRSPQYPPKRKCAERISRQTELLLWHARLQKKISSRLGRSAMAPTYHF